MQSSVGIFAAYLCVYNVVVGVYFVNTAFNFYDFLFNLRSPVLLLLEILLNAFLTNCIVTRQIMSDLHRDFPCNLMNLATHLALTSYAGIFILRAFHLFVLMDSELKAKYYKLMTSSRLCAWWCLLTAVGVALYAGLNRVKLCNTR